MAAQIGQSCDLSFHPSRSSKRQCSTDDSLARWRAETPGTAHRVHLNNAGAALMPSPVIEAINAHIALESEIGGYEAADARESAIARTYEEIAGLINSATRNVAIVANATAGFIQAMSSFDFARGDCIVTTRSDYTSHQIQLLALSRRLGIEILHADDLPEGGVDPASVRALASRPNCRLVHVSWVPTHSGLVQDVEAVGAVCESLGVPYLIDACQAVGQIPIDVQALRCDYLAVTARKFLRGPRGVGFLYASDRALARGDHPLYVDMRGARWTGPESYELADSAIRFEDWEFAYALVLGLAEATKYARGIGVDVAQRRAWSSPRIFGRCCRRLMEFACSIAAAFARRSLPRKSPAGIRRTYRWRCASAASTPPRRCGGMACSTSRREE